MPLSPEVLTAPLIGATGVAYVAGLDRLWRRLGHGVGVSQARAVAFMAGVVTLGVALASPLDGAAERTLAAHMTQHLLLDSLAAPLLALGEPLVVLSQLLGNSVRLRVRRLGAQAARSANEDRWWAWALVLVAIHTVVMVGWHVPALYDAAVRNDALHALEHVSLVVVGTALWWLLLGSGRRRPAGGSVLVLFAATLPLALLGLFMVLARTHWYPIYATSLADQQVAGALLWGAGGAVAVIQGALLFAAWLADTPDDAIQPRPNPGPELGGGLAASTTISPPSSS